MRSPTEYSSSPPTECTTWSATRSSGRWIGSEASGGERRSGVFSSRRGSRRVLASGAMRGRKAGRKLLVRREDVSDGGFGSLEKSVEVTYEAAEGREGPEAKNI